MKPSAACAIATGGATLTATLVVTVASLVVRSFANDGIWYVFGWLTTSILVIGVTATVIAVIIGLVRAKYSGHPTQHAPATPKWTGLTLLFVVVAPAVIMYMLTVMWLTNAMYVGALALIIGIIAGPIYLIVQSLISRAIRPRQSTDNKEAP